MHIDIQTVQMYPTFNQNHTHKSVFGQILVQQLKAFLNAKAYF